MWKSIIAAASLLLVTVCVAHEGHEAGDVQGTIVVESVMPDSPAAAAGLQAGDILVRLDGQEMASHDALRQVMAAHQPGDTVPLVVQRGDEAVELALAFGERPDGGVSIGVRLEIRPDPNTEPGEGTVGCLGWIEETYRIKQMSDALELDLSEDHETLRACVTRDTSMMATADAIKYCDNVFKVHCGALDLLGEIAEAQVRRCEEHLAGALEVSPREHKGWKTCGQHKVYDRYAMNGQASDETACRAAFDDCAVQP